MVSWKTLSSEKIVRSSDAAVRSSSVAAVRSSGAAAGRSSGWQVQKKFVSGCAEKKISARPG